jgi:hypothetical protein
LPPLVVAPFERFANWRQCPVRVWLSERRSEYDRAQLGSGDRLERKRGARLFRLASQYRVIETGMTRVR